LEDKYFRSPLWIASMLGREEFVRELLENAAAVDCLSESRTPLYIAVQNNRLDAVQVLIQYGANIELPDRNGRRPVELAHELEMHEMKALLISHGAIYYSKEPPKLNIAMQAVIPGKVHHPIVNISEIPENAQFWVFTNTGSLYVFSSKTNKLLATCMSLLPFSETFDFTIVVVGTNVWCLSAGRIAIFEWNKSFVNPNEETNYIEFRGKIHDEKENRCVIEKKSWKLDQEIHTIFAVENNMYGLVTPSSIIVWSLKTFEGVTKIQLFMSIFPKVYDCQCRVALGVAPDTSIFISVRNFVYVFEGETFASHYTLSGEADDIKTMVATSKFVYTTGRFDFMLRIWDLQSRSLVGCIDNAKYDLLFQISQDRFASNHLKTIKIWDKDFQAISEFSTPHIEGIATMLWSSKNKRCWIAGNDNNISVWVLQVV
jgi:WD40 repeat protein